MNWFDRFIRVTTIVLILAVIYLFFTMIQAIDRLHFSNMKLTAALEKAKSGKKGITNKKVAPAKAKKIKL